MKKPKPKKNTKQTDKSQEYLEGWQRAVADLQNFKKQQLEAGKVIQEQAQVQAIIPFLSLSDNLQSVISHVPEDLAGNSWVQGVLHVARQLESVLADLNVTRIDDLSEPFSPDRHEAIEEVTGKGKAGGIAAVTSPGYAIGDTVIRPAKVKIIK